MREITIKVYQYSELDEKAKDKARNWWFEVSSGDTFSWDCMKEDAKTVGLKLEGVDNRRNMTGSFITSAPECAESIIREHGESCETFKTAKAYLDSVKPLIDLCSDEMTYEQEQEREEKDAEFLRSLLEDYRILLEKQEEYEQSEEYIAEIMEANEYEFTKEGKRI